MVYLNTKIIHKLRFKIGKDVKFYHINYKRLMDSAIVIAIILVIIIVVAVLYFSSTSNGNNSSQRAPVGRIGGFNRPNVGFHPQPGFNRPQPFFNRPPFFHQQFPRFNFHFLPPMIYRPQFPVVPLTVVTNPLPITTVVTEPPSPALQCYQPDGSLAPCYPYLIPTSRAVPSNTFNLNVVTKDASDPYFGQGSTLCFAIDGVQGKTLNLKRGVAYQFNVDMPGHPVYFSTTPEGVGTNPITQPSSCVVTPTSIGGCSVSITFDNTFPNQFFYACGVHPFMGGKIILGN